MILLSYSNSSIKDTEILGSFLYLSLLRPAILHVCNVEENVLLTLILGSVFNDYVVFYRDVFFRPRARMLARRLLATYHAQ